MGTSSRRSGARQRETRVAAAAPAGERLKSRKVEKSKNGPSTDSLNLSPFQCGAPAARAGRGWGALGKSRSNPPKGKGIRGTFFFLRGKGGGDISGRR